ncbi:MAG: VWA domain-containing protein [Fusobacteriaceae bacterium]
MGFFSNLFGRKKEKEEVKQFYDEILPKTPTINLSKDEKITISLSKKNVSAVVAEVKLVIDSSGSMSHLFRCGAMEETIKRIAPLAFRFDDNGLMETCLFDNDVRELPDVSLNNIHNYFFKNNLCNAPTGGTYYHKPIRKIIEQAKNGEFKFPAFVIFITDGEPMDPSQTRDALIEASNYDIYFQFVGIGSESFKFLQEMDNLKGRKFDNAGFIGIRDLTRISDEELYDSLLDEFVDNCKNGVLKSAKVTKIDLSKK